MRKVILFTVVLTLSAISCINAQIQNDNTDQDSIQMTGNDRDEHGCIGSAGYTWSELEKECVQIFRSGTSFDAYGSNTDDRFAAYVIVAKNKSKAEVFLPKHPGNGIILNAFKSKSKNTDPVLFENTKEKIKITRQNDLFLIYVNDEAVFSQKYSKSEGLGKEIK